MSAARILVLLALEVAGCAYAAPITAVAEAACIAVTDAEFPAAEPLCIFGDELALEVESYIASHGGTAPAVRTVHASAGPTSKATGTTAVPHDLFDALSRRPGVRMRKAVRQ